MEPFPLFIQASAEYNTEATVGESDTMMTFPDPKDSDLAIMLDACLPFRIHDYAARGGPGDYDFERARSTTDLIGECGDILLCGGKGYGDHKGQTPATIFARLADALAVMSFFPGGVPFCGRHWMASSGFPYEVCPLCHARHAGTCRPPENGAVREEVACE